MAFQLDARNIPRIEDYAAALKRWHSIKPWRGNAECDARPLDNGQSPQAACDHPFQRASRATRSCAGSMTRTS